jgi:hypothetical protein
MGNCGTKIESRYAMRVESFSDVGGFMYDYFGAHRRYWMCNEIVFVAMDAFIS